MDPALLQNWNFSVRYDLLDRFDKVIKSKTNAFRTGLSFFQDQSRRFLTPTFYMEPGTIPAESRSETLTHDDVAGASRIRLRLTIGDPQIFDILVRCYFRTETSDLRSGGLWKRLSPEDRERLARGNIYPHQLLSENERLNLLRFTWRPLAPQGIENRNFRSRQLYTLKERPAAVPRRSVNAEGLLISQGRIGTIRLPESGRQFKLTFVPTERSSQAAAVVLTWYGESPQIRSTNQLQWAGKQFDFETNCHARLVQIQTSTELVVRGFADTNGASRQIATIPSTLRGYAVTPNAPITFKLSVERVLRRPFRADLRYVLQPATDERERTPVQYEILSETQNVIDAGVLYMNAGPSVFDGISGNEEKTVTDPERFFFSLPPETGAVRFFVSSTNETSTPFVSAFTRPASLVREQRVPAERYAREDETARTPAWFSVRPSEHEIALRENRSIAFDLLPRPPEDRPDLMSGEYQWEQFFAAGDMRGRTILCQPEYPPPLREQLLPVNYHRLNTRSAERLVFPEFRGQAKLTPRLAWIRNASTAEHLEIFIDEQRYSTAIAGSRGEWMLPDVSSGPHSILLSAEPNSTFLLNHLSPTEGDYLKRFVYTLREAPLIYRYNRLGQADENLSFRFYAGVNVMVPSVITVSIVGPELASVGPFSSWTFRNREFYVSPPAGTGSVTFGSDESLNSGETFFFPVGEDLPEGNYQIEVALKSGPAGYLSLSRMNPGAAELRAVFREGGIDNELSD